MSQHKGEPDGLPELEQEIHAPEDVYELVDDQVLGTASHYGFSCAEEMVDYVLGRNGYEGILKESHEDLLEEESERDSVLERDYSYAGSVWYSPENGDCWISDDEELLDG